MTLTGTISLLRLAWRRDRVKLPLWVLALGGLIAASVASAIDTYTSNHERLLYATTGATSVVARVFNGITPGTHIGTIVTAETFSFMSLLVALMSAQTIVRHTRQNEETGRSELIGAAVVGRHAQLAAAMLLTILANGVLSTIIIVSLVAQGLPWGGSVALGLDFAAVGLVFASIAAVTSQIMDNSRSANATAGAILGLAFLVRGIGDSLGDIEADGLVRSSAWLTWLSPLGWATQARPFEGLRWAVFVPLVMFAVAATGLAVVLSNHRDMGSGMVPVRRGPAQASASLGGTLGLAWRLHRVTLLGWAVAIALFAAMFGGVADQINTMVKDNEQLRDIMRDLGGTENLVKGYLAYTMTFAGLAVSACACQTLQRLRSEEVGGRLEVLLATPTGRYRWLFSHLLWIMAGVVGLLVMAGAAAGITYGLIIDDPVHQTAQLICAGLVQIVPVTAFVGLTVMVFGLLPRYTTAVSWGLLGTFLVLEQMGALLEIPQVILNISPYTHTPDVPVDSATAAPLVIVGLIAIALGLLGALAFRRRDLKP